MGDPPDDHHTRASAHDEMAHVRDHQPTGHSSVNHGTGHREAAAHGPSHHEMMVADFRRRFWVSLIVTVPILLLSPGLRGPLHLEALAFPGDNWLILALAAFVYGWGGLPFLRGAVREIFSRQPAMMTLIAVAISAAFLYSAAVVIGVRGTVFFWELATLVDIMLLGHWLEMRSVMGASRALEELARLMPDEAHLLDEQGNVHEVPLAELGVGDRVLIRPGEKVPIDGKVAKGASAVNEAMLTGESTPVEKAAGDAVIGGSINGEGSLEVMVEKTGADTYLSQVIDLVRQAQESRSRSQDLADRAAFVLTLTALSVGAVTLAAWLLLGRDFQFALGRSITVMVITCPHALGLAIPLVVAVSTALGAKSGLLIRDRTAFERSRTVNAVVFDKTGTLTEGRFGVNGIWTFADVSENDLLRRVASLESRSQHPIAQGIVRSANERGLALPALEDFTSIPGKGVEGTVEGRHLMVVSPGYLSEQGHSAPSVDTQGRPLTLVYVLEGKKPLGALGLADVVREESREAVAGLRALGIKAVMITGDNDTVAKWVAEDLELDEYFAGVLPEHKAKRVKELQEQGLVVGMVGDGVNDAPALVQADVGVAIGAGTDVAIESADIVLVQNDPRNVLDLFSLSRATWSKMVQNLGWATGYNLIAVPLAAGVAASAGIVLSPAVGAALMSASTIIVAINARLLRARRTMV
ncbi:MAG: cadmium-translocating P-type ATPase [Actinobacteria bacterium]|nr:cadmium-translocating P-type ATPase [Actinomycetota bacterium]